MVTDTGENSEAEDVALPLRGAGICVQAAKSHIRTK